MFQNSVKSFYNQQSGFGKWQDCNIIMPRYHCKAEHAFTKLLDTETEDLHLDTPIFACKFAQHPGYEHLVALANEDGKLAVHNCIDNSRYGGQAHNNAIFDLAWMFDNMKIVTASGDHTAKLFDINNGEVREERSFYGHTRSVKTVTFRNGDSSVFSTGGRDGNIILWDIRSVQFSFIGRPDRTIYNSHVSNNYTPSKRKKSPASSGVKSVTGLVFQDDNTLISCGAGDGNIKVWDLRRHYSAYQNNPTPKYVIPHLGKTAKNGFSSLIIDGQGTRLYANCLDHSIYCYNIGTYSDRPVMSYTGHQNSSFYIKSSLSKDGDYIISGSSDKNAYIWSTRSPKPLVRLVGHLAEVTSVAWCHINNCLVTCSDDMTHKLWTVGNEPATEEWESHSRGMSEVVVREPEKVYTKRRLDTIVEETPKKFITECENCKCAMNCLTQCEVCNRKRRPSCELVHDNKKQATDFGPKRLFTGQNLQVNDALATRLEETNTEFNSPTTSRFHDFAPASPTINLPNFVVDGIAPHLSYSPPKKKGQDWLTSMRMDRQLKRQMREKAADESSPKVPRLDATPTRRLRRAASPKSPLLRFFKVTNGTKCDGHACSNKLHGCGNFVSSPKSSR